MVNQPNKERITLIFSGKILKDPDQIQSYGIKDGMAVRQNSVNNLFPLFPGAHGDTSWLFATAAFYHERTDSTGHKFVGSDCQSTFFAWCNAWWAEC
jgi:hypothetical protein